MRSSAGSNGPESGGDPVPERHAVVVGGSLAGLFAAYVLAGYADRVTVVERDRFPDGPEPRPGVPQSRHTHILLSAGLSAMESLLPGFAAELEVSGATRVGQPSDVVMWHGGHWVRRTEASTYFHTGPRPQLDLIVRRRVLAHPHISVVQGAEVVGLLGTAARVRGVLLRERGPGVPREPRSLDADLVVDASGRGSRAPQWLTALGAKAPYEETVDTGLAYGTRRYRDVKEILGGGTVGYHIVPNRSQPHLGVVMPQGDGTFLATLSGLRGQEPPTEEAAFTAYAKRLPHPAVHRWMTEAEPVGPVYSARRNADVRRRYDRPGAAPAGFLATGDALCAFNPIYGQGMSVAALSALALRDVLDGDGRSGTATTHRVQQALLAPARRAWDIATGADKDMPGAIGTAATTGAADRVTNWYMNRLQERAGGDPVVGHAFRSVAGLVAPARTLFAPAVARAVLLGSPGPTPAEPPSRPEDRTG